ncbi:MAG TPA: hypothetical protein VFT95_12425, partial [Micromonosporaceae bacterium]|nr:hypothetical protein [Micromonosporaceae bacterium]
MRHTTVLAGIALGLVLVIALTLAGAIGIDPLPGFPPDGQAPNPSGALSATQPELRRSLLDADDLPPGYTAAPDTARADRDPGAAKAGADRRRATPGPSPSGANLLPDVDLTDLPIDEEVLGGTPSDRDETAHDGAAGEGAGDGAGAGEEESD